MSFHPTTGRTCIVLFLLLTLVSIQQVFAQTEKNALFSLTDPNDLYNQTIIFFNPNATDGMDSLHDVQTLSVTAGFDVYSKIGAGDFKIQTLADLVADKTVTLGLNTVATGSYMLRLEETGNMDESVAIVVEDTLTGTFQNLRNNPVYIFTSGSGTDIQRLKIHFYPPFALSSTGITCAGNPGAVHLTQPGSYSWNYEVMDETNTVIDTGTINGVKTLDHLEKGNYTINLQDAFGYELTKEIYLDGKEPVEAQFEVSEEAVQAGEAVHLYDYSIGASDLTWNFGDGTVITNDAFPTHHFAQPGTYEVVLLASNDDCQQSFSKTIHVSDVASGIGQAQQDAVRFHASGTDLIVNVPALVESAQVQVFNLLGQAVHTENIPATSEQRIALEGKCQFCIVQIITADGAVTGGKVLLSE